MFPLVAVGLFVLLALVGSAVDIARAYKAERRLQSACDAGVLAGRRAVGTSGFDSAAEAQASQYFNANYDQESQQTNDAAFSADSDDNGNTVAASATATLPSALMNIFGIGSLDLSVSCTASMGIGNSDVVFVLDNTGSMAWTPDGDDTNVDYEDSRMFALQEAMKSFYETVAAANGGSNARIRYGFVPYSSSVNVGRLLMDTDSNYVADAVTVQSRRPVNWSGVVATWTQTGTPTSTEADDWERLNPRYTGGNAEQNCKNAKPNDDANWIADGSPDVDTTSHTFDPDRGQRVSATGSHQDYYKRDYECIYRDGNSSQRGWYINRRYLRRTITSYTYQARNPVTVASNNTTFSNWLYEPISYSTASYKMFSSVSSLVRASGSRTANSSSTWSGCILERQTTPADAFTFVSLLTGITPAAALDLDIDAAPTGDPATQWAPLWDNVTYRRSSTEASTNGDSYDSTGSGTSWPTLYRYTHCPQQSQLLAEMEEDDFGDYVDSLTPVGSTYHDIGLLWGARISSPTGIFADTVGEEPRNGGTVSRHVIFMTDGELAPTDSVNSAYGIERLDRRVTGNGNSEDQIDNHRSRYLAICEAIKARGIRLWVIAFGTDLNDDLIGCASPGSSFQADNAGDLEENFQEIANQVGELRVVQ